MRNQISGVLAAIATPFTSSGEPDIDRFVAHGEWLLDEGCNGLNVLGTTGEANSQSSKMRAFLMRSAAESTLRRGALMVGTGTPSVDETIELTRLAAELKFDAALLLPPYYYKGVSDDGLFDYFDKVIRAVGTTDIGIYLYNFPQMTGLTFSRELVERLLEAFPQHMQGMKDSSGDLEYTSKMADAFGDRFDVFPGSEGPLPDAIERGYAGCISASVNATARIAARVWRQRDSVAAADIAELRELRDGIASVPMVAAVKTLIATRTGDDGWRRVLPPLIQLNEQELRTIDSIAERLGLRR